MTRSFWLDKSVVAASRKFICIRLGTYENKQDADFLGSIFSGRSGVLENTVFTVFAPDGKRQLVRAGRGPRYSDGAEMARELERMAQRYPYRRSSSSLRALPCVPTVRLALNVAACDSLPLAVVLAKSARTRAKLEKRLAALAWSDALVGRLIHARASSAAEMKGISGLPSTAGILIIELDRFGQSRKVVAHFGSSAKLTLIQQRIQALLAARQPAEKESGSHVRAGRRQGVVWKTAVPITDPGGSRRRR